MSNPNRSGENEKPIIGITIGDYNGIAPELIIKTFSDPRITRFFTPVIYASGKLFSFYRKIIDTNFVYHQIKNFGEMNPRKVNLVNVWDDNIEFQPGKNDPASGKYALMALKLATDDLRSGHLDGVVTCPINKDNMQSEEFSFPGHTEYLADAFDAKDYLMLMVSDQIRIGVVTGHIPLKEVPSAITTDKVISKIQVLVKSLKQDFGIAKPKVAVLGVNPHAGENGLLGKEEIEVIKPAIDTFKGKGQLVFGPFPADGFFGTMAFKKYDGVLAMYHDQGLTPFKYMAFENGVNYTAGLPIVRTSPDHGTAYDIAGKNIADDGSFREALYLAAQIASSRKSMATA